LALRVGKHRLRDILSPFSGILRRKQANRTSLSKALVITTAET